MMCFLCKRKHKHARIIYADTDLAQRAITSYISSYDMAVMPLICIQHYHSSLMTHAGYSCHVFIGEKVLHDVASSVYTALT